MDDNAAKGIIVRQGLSKYDQTYIFLEDGD